MPVMSTWMFHSCLFTTRFLPQIGSMHNKTGRAACSSDQPNSGDAAAPHSPGTYVLKSILPTEQYYRPYRISEFILTCACPSPNIPNYISPCHSCTSAFLIKPRSRWSNPCNLWGPKVCTRCSCSVALHICALFATLSATAMKRVLSVLFILLRAARAAMTAAELLLMQHRYCFNGYTQVLSQTGFPSS